MNRRAFIKISPVGDNPGFSPRSEIRITRYLLDATSGTSTCKEAALVRKNTTTS